MTKSKSMIDVLKRVDFNYFLDQIESTIKI